MKTKDCLTVVNENRPKQIMDELLITLTFSYVGFDNSYLLFTELFSALISAIETGRFNELKTGVNDRASFSIPMSSFFSYLMNRPQLASSRKHLAQENLISNRMLTQIVMRDPYEMFGNPGLSFASKFFLSYTHFNALRDNYPEVELNQRAPLETQSEQSSFSIALLQSISIKFCQTSSDKLQDELLLLIKKLVSTFSVNEKLDVLMQANEVLERADAKKRRLGGRDQYLINLERFYLSLKSLVSNSSIPPVATAATVSPGSGFDMTPLAPLSFDEITVILTERENISLVYDAFCQFKKMSSRLMPKQIRAVYNLIFDCDLKKLAPNFLDPFDRGPAKQLFLNLQGDFFDSLSNNRAILTKKMAVRVNIHLRNHFSQVFVESYPELFEKMLAMLDYSYSLVIDHPDLKMQVFNVFLNGLHWGKTVTAFDRDKIFQYMERCIISDKLYIKRLFQTFHFWIPEFPNAVPGKSRQIGQKQTQANALELFTYLYTSPNYEDTGIRTKRLLETAMKAVLFCARSVNGDVRLKPATKLLLAITKYLASDREYTLFHYPDGSGYLQKYPRVLLALLNNDDTLLDGIELYFLLRILNQVNLEIPDIGDQKLYSSQQSYELIQMLCSSIDSFDQLSRSIMMHGESSPDGELVERSDEEDDTFFSRCKLN